MSGEHILLVEDDPAIVTGLVTKLEIEGFVVSVASDGARAQKWLEVSAPDLVVLDIMLPELDGLSLLRWLRRRTTTLPVLILSARGREEQKVEGLQAGADDYLAKPFGLAELLARVSALLRRARGGRARVQFGEVEIDVESNQVFRAGEPVALSAKELGLLLFLVRRPNVTHPRETIHASVWGELDVCDPRAVDFHMVNLRRKLETDPKSPAHLLTRHGRGYELSLPR